MSTFMPQGLIDEARALQLSAMDPATIVETSTSIVCRVVDHKSSEHPDNMPRHFHLEYIDLLLPYDTPIVAGQHISQGGATFCVLITPAKTPFRTARRVLAVDPASALFNEKVTLTSNLTGEVISNLAVPVWPAGLDARIFPDAVRFTWAIGFPVGLTFSPSHEKISSGDTVTCSWFSNGAEISEPRFNADPGNPLMVAYFKERPS